MKMANADLRAEAKAAYVPFWRIAEALNISEPTMTRKLRRELSTGEKAEMKAIIARLKSEARQESRREV